MQDSIKNYGKRDHEFERKKKGGLMGGSRVKKESNYILISKIEINLKIFKE